MRKTCTLYRNIDTETIGETVNDVSHELMLCQMCLEDTGLFCYHQWGVDHSELWGVAMTGGWQLSRHSRSDVCGWS